MFLRRLACATLLLAAAAALAACQPDSPRNARADQPIPTDVLSLMSTKGMHQEDPVLMRIFKEQSRLEVWKKRPADGRYALLKSYQICRWSGDLGPKIKTGDRQAPEGFYPITPALMNPNSHYYLSFNTGFPNTFDRAHGRTGSDVMVHGDCLSAGCYAMTDAQMAEIYAIAREAFRGGQREFQLQIYPFQMTAENMAQRRTSKDFAFWKNLKTGYDHFAVTAEEPKVAVCHGNYVFDATPEGGARFDPNAPCPAYTVPPQIQAAVTAKERADNQKFAELVRADAPLATAYVPQDGRLRRALNQPVHMDRFGNLPVVATAAVPPLAAQPVSAAADTRIASAHALVAAPAPAAAPLQITADAPHQSHGGLLAWVEGDSHEASATKRSAPFYTRLLHLGGSHETAAAAQPAATPVAAPVPLPAAKPSRRHDNRTAYLDRAD